MILKGVKDNVKELFKDHILIPKIQYQSNPSTQNQQSVESRPVSEFVREFRQRLALGENRDQTNNANRQQPQSHTESNPIYSGQTQVALIIFILISTKNEEQITEIITIEKQYE